MALREDCMKRRAAAALAMKPAGARGLVFMAHAFHLAKDDRLFDPKAMGVGPGGGLVPSLGHHLVQEKGLKAYAVWMLYGEGEDSQPFPDLPRKANYPETSLNRRLALFDEPVLLPLDDAPAALTAAPVGVGHMYNAVVPTRLKDQVDAIYFVPRVTPLQG
jgi:erythromycin esterase-like protein